MTQFTPSVAPREGKSPTGRVVADLGDVFSGVLINVGCRLDLHQAMADLCGCTSSVSLLVTLARLMIGAAILAGARLSVIAGAISQRFGAANQDGLPCARYFNRHRARPVGAVPVERKGTGS